jgi:transmembrane sensor
MTDPRADPISERIHSEAAAWIVRSQAGGPHAERKLSQWLAADPRHRAAYDAIAGTWGESLGLSGSLLARDRKLPRAPMYMRRSTHLAAAAASVAIVICASTAWMSSQGPFAPLISPAEAHTYSTAVGELRTIRLGDGSSITLDTSSRVKVIAGKSTMLELEQGRVRVTPSGSRRLFEITSNGAAATVKGGAFDVFVFDGTPAITTVEAPLDVQTATHGGDRIERTLVTGDVADLRSGAVSPHATNADLRWVEGMVALDKTRLAVAIVAINRYNQVQIRLADPALAERPVSGAFRARDPAAFARALAAMFNLKLSQPSPDEIVLARGD